MGFARRSRFTAGCPADLSSRVILFGDELGRQRDAARGRACRALRGWPRRLHDARAGTDAGLDDPRAGCSRAAASRLSGRRRPEAPSRMEQHGHTPRSIHGPASEPLFAGAARRCWNRAERHRMSLPLSHRVQGVGRAVRRGPPHECPGGSIDWRNRSKLLGIAVACSQTICQRPAWRSQSSVIHPLWVTLVPPGPPAMMSKLTL